MTETGFGDLVIVIPGILGSRLVRPSAKGDVTVWDMSLRTLPRVLKEARDGSLTLKSHDGKPDDDVVARELFNYQLLPGFFGVDDYEPLLRSLRSVLPSPKQLLTFPYDWRGSNVFAAEALATMALPALHDWRRASGRSQARLWLICHSMGGLVARYFCEHLGGAEVTAALVTFGTPHRGAMKALDKLVNGMSLALGLLDLSATVRSLPSAYELLPLYPAIRVAGPADQVVMKRVADFFDLDPVTGAAAERKSGLQALPHLDVGMLRRAIEFHRNIRQPAEARWRDGTPSPYQLRAFFNRRQVTPTSGRWANGRLEVLDTVPVRVEGGELQENRRGDGTVPSSSALPIEWPDTGRAIALPDKHAAAHAALAGMDTLANWMRPDDVRDWKGPPMPAEDGVVALQVPDAIRVGDELVVQVSSLAAVNMHLVVTNLASGAPRKVPAQTRGQDQVSAMSLGTLGEGAYKIEVVPTNLKLPRITDYVIAIEP
jgi:hypothetical protein